MAPTPSIMSQRSDGFRSVALLRFASTLLDGNSFLPGLVGGAGRAPFQEEQGEAGRDDQGAPHSIAGVGESPKTNQPKTSAQTISVY